MMLAIRRDLEKPQNFCPRLPRGLLLYPLHFYPLGKPPFCGMGAPLCVVTTSSLCCFNGALVLEKHFTFGWGHNVVHCLSSLAHCSMPSQSTVALETWWDVASMGFSNPPAVGLSLEAFFLLLHLSKKLNPPNNLL